MPQSLRRGVGQRTVSGKTGSWFLSSGRVSPRNVVKVKTRPAPRAWRREAHSEDAKVARSSVFMAVSRIFQTSCRRPLETRRGTARPVGGGGGSVSRGDWRQRSCDNHFFSPESMLSGNLQPLATPSLSWRQGLCDLIGSRAGSSQLWGMGERFVISQQGGDPLGTSTGSPPPQRRFRHPALLLLSSHRSRPHINPRLTRRPRPSSFRQRPDSTTTPHQFISGHLRSAADNPTKPSKMASSSSPATPLL